VRPEAGIDAGIAMINLAALGHAAENFSRAIIPEKRGREADKLLVYIMRRDGEGDIIEIGANHS
jgi:hypothetical protein